MASPSSKIKPYFRYLQLFSAFLGIALSLYLLAQHTRLKSGIQGGSSFCSLGKYADCDLVSTSPYSEILGVPLAAIGAIYYFVLLLLVLLTPRKASGIPASQTWLARGAAAGLAVDLALFGIQVALIHSLCLMCFLTYLANVGILVGIALRERSHWKNSLRNALKGDPRAQPILPHGPLRVALAISLVLFVALVGFLPTVIRVTSQKYALVDGAIEQFFNTWPEKKLRIIEYKAGDGVMGNPQSPVRIVEFSDFECPFCRGAAFTLHTALEPIKDKVFFVFKHFPLDPACNPAVTFLRHPNACSLARLGFCAQKKGKFWEFHDAIFLKLNADQISGGITVFGPQLKEIFGQEEIASCLNDPASLDNVGQDGRLGRSLEIHGTPAVFVNGKHVSIPLSVENLRRLVELETSLQQKTAP